MVVIVGIVMACAMFVTLSGTVFADSKVFGLLREQRRTMPAEVRRRANRMVAMVIPVTWGYVAFLFLIAPLGRRAIVIWFLIVPFLVLAPLGTIAAGVRAYRLGRDRGSGEGDRWRPRPRS
jgi:hypothetical protein